ncbi:MAG: cysteine desulfurase [Candidatus Cloacimonetes bacterium]|nr:cysteine desulfurase [Candidatus Cloacimonadota bacterium]
MQRIDLDNCLTTKPDPLVVEAMLPFLSDKYYFPSNFVKTGENAKKELNNFRSVIADSLHTDISEIHLTSGGTMANNIAIKGYILSNSDKGAHIICSEIDYPDILTNAAFFEESGFEVTYLKADREGFIDLQELENSIRQDTILVMTTLANHVLGTIQPVKKIKEIIKSKNKETALFIDAGHAYGRMAIDVKDLDCELLSLSGHKIHAPQGAGALFVKKGVQLAPSKHGINRIDPLDTGGISIAALAGMAKAVELQFADLPAVISHIESLRDRLFTGLEKNLGKLCVNGAWGEHRICHNLNISLTDIEGEGLMMLLDMAGITVATGSACASQGLKPNYVLIATGRSFVESHGSIKFTLSRMTTADEIDYVIEQFTAAVQKLRKLSPLAQK